MGTWERLSPPEALLPPASAHVGSYTQRQTLAGGPEPAPSPGGDTHGLVADVECEQGVASAGGLVQGVS